MQPVQRGSHGEIRFKPNAIVRDIVDNAANMLAQHPMHRPGLDLNQIITDYHRGKYTQEDVEQFWQMMGYSLSGYAELSFISDETVAAADDAARTAFDLKGPVSCHGNGCTIPGGHEVEEDD